MAGPPGVGSRRGSLDETMTSYAAQNSDSREPAGGDNLRSSWRLMTLGEPGVIGAWLEMDLAQARQAILSPLALCSICGNGSGGTTQDSKPSPPAMGAVRRSIHRLLDSNRSSAFPR